MTEINGMCLMCKHLTTETITVCNGVGRMPVDEINYCSACGYNVYDEDLLCEHFERSEHE